MKHKMPKSPFVTRMSGSAKETELRIRNIFQWKKKRPPVILLLAAVLVVAACGSLVGFYTVAPEPAQLQISMDTQYYDIYENYIEIPKLIWPEGEEANQAVTAINQALTNLKGEYQAILNGAVGAEKYGLDGVGNHCLFYPTATDRYINLLFFREIMVTDLNTGHVLSLVYDKEEQRQVTIEDALALAGVTEQELYDALSAQYDPQLAQETPEANIIIQNQALEGFRMDKDGKPIFYVTARTDDADDTIQDYVSGADNLYIWSDGLFKLYDQYMNPQPLIPVEETVKLDPPLWCQWYFDGGEPEGALENPQQEPSMPEKLDDMPLGDGSMRADESESTALIAYRETLMRMLQEVNETGQATLPDGVSKLGFWTGTDHLEENLFAVCDADGDGRQELLFRYLSTFPMAQTEYIFGCDASGELWQKFSMCPLASYYDNGLMISRWGSQNESITIWPYGVFRYEPDDGVYNLVADVLSWEKGSRPRGLEYDEDDFPDDVDVDGDGVVYVVGTRDSEDSMEFVMMDRAAYEQWYDDFLAGAQEILPDWKPFTAESIAAIA